MLNSNENYMLFGTNCSDNCLPAQRYVTLIFGQIRAIENKVFNLKHAVSVKCRLGELPNDMKMLAFLCGELSNSKILILQMSPMTMTKTLMGHLEKKKYIK